MDMIFEKIRVNLEKLESMTCLDSKAIDYDFSICDIPTHGFPYSEGLVFESSKSHPHFSGCGIHIEVKFKLPMLTLDDGTEYRLSFRTGREPQWNAKNPQGLLYVDGKAAQGIDTNHTWYPIDCEHEHKYYLHLYGGLEGGEFTLDISLLKIDKETEALKYDVGTAYNALKCLPEGSREYIKLRDILDRALIMLDYRGINEGDFARSVSACRDFLKCELYNDNADKNVPIVDIIGHTHIDVAWQWRTAQTREKAQRSFATMLSLIKRYPEFLFMSSQPQLYEYVKEEDPELYSRIKQAVADGRWEPEGAMWLEADTNLTSGESLVRQIIYGKRFFKEEFGIDSHLLWLPDVFGYSAALPQIMKKSGIDGFFTAKISWSETNSLPHDIFLWQGIDGSEIFSSLINSYVNVDPVADVYNTSKNFKDKSLSNRSFVTLGYGDGGGSTTAEMLETCRRLERGIIGMPKIKLRRASEYFDLVKGEFFDNCEKLRYLPRFVGELYLEMHRGTYTTMAKNKKNNRKSELGMQSAETLALADMLFRGTEYPRNELRKAQETMLLDQFHDILPGSSIKGVYDDTDADYREVFGVLNKIVGSALDGIASNIKTPGGVLVYNPSPFEQSEILELDGVKYNAGNIPAHGYKVVRDIISEDGVRVGDRFIENEFVKIVFDENFDIVSILDCELGEFVKTNERANRLEIYEDYPRNYDAWEITSYYKQKMWIVSELVSARPIEGGFEVVKKYGHSEFAQRITLLPHSRRIDFKTRIDWHEDHVLLKAAFPLDIHTDYADCEIAFGNIKRPTHANTSWDAAKFEFCAHKWVDMSEGGRGVGLLNDCKYGYSAEGDKLSLTLLKAPTWPNPEADRELHEFTYSLFLHDSDYRNGTVKQAYALNMPLVARPIFEQEGELPEEFSLVSADVGNAVVETVKLAEDSDDIIVRLYESYNKKTTAKLTCGFDFDKVFECDLLENELCELEHKGREVKLKLSNFEIKTLKFVK